jgi:hypothetical protein
LLANYGRKLTFDEWYARVIELSHPLQPEMTEVADVTISHSVLEHIPRRTLPVFLRALSDASRPGGWFSHTVDLGPHGHGDGTLASLYRMNRDQELPHLNLLRKCDVESAMIDAGLDLRASVIYKADELNEICVHKSWQRYSRDDLATRVVFFLGMRPHLSGAWFGTAFKSDQLPGSSQQNASA